MNFEKMKKKLQKILVRLYFYFIFDNVKILNELTKKM